MGDLTSFKEIGSFTVMLVPIMAAVIWGGKVLLAWFTRTIEREQESKDKLMEELVSIMRETQQAHHAMLQEIMQASKDRAEEHARFMDVLHEGRLKSQEEHKAIIDCVGSRPSVPLTG